MKKKFELNVWCFPDEKYWEIDAVGIHVRANTLRDAFVKFGNACKRVKNKELEKFWGDLNG